MTFNRKCEFNQREQFERICNEYPCFGKIHNIIWEFKGILTGKNVDALDKWMEKAKKLGIPEIDSFICGLERDLDAVRNAIKYEYSNGLAEGSINKLKVIKRVMYGRSSFETLRIKTLRLEKMRLLN
ncbi:MULTISPECIES: transposase [Thermoanaerobacterium]|uniref:transposase n=1 Tax=Thermoanaerobacterium aotearoense TaxID=47490 RepID=UPI0022772A73|nr:MULTISPECIES: transposase [Thermoanaerobacterium]